MKTTRILNDLQECGFIKKIPTFGKKNNATYKLIDNYTLFYMKFVRENESNDERFWSHSYLSPVRTSWVGLAFERMCFQHVPQIKKALGISGVVTNVYAWRIGPTADGEAGAQIDMLIDRADNMVNLCEMKFSKNEYTVKCRQGQIHQPHYDYREGHHPHRALERHPQHNHCGRSV